MSHDQRCPISIAIWSFWSRNCSNSLYLVCKNGRYGTLLVRIRCDYLGPRSCRSSRKAWICPCMSNYTSVEDQGLKEKKTERYCLWFEFGWKANENANPDTLGDIHCRSNVDILQWSHVLTCWTVYRRSILDCIWLIFQPHRYDSERKLHASLSAKAFAVLERHRSDNPSVHSSVCSNRQVLDIRCGRYAVSSIDHLIIRR